MVVQTLAYNSITLFFFFFSDFTLPTSVLLSLFFSITSLLTYAPISACCADVASCHSRSISHCSSLPKGFALTHTCMHTQSHSHAHLCLLLPRGQLPPMATCSQSSLVSIPGWLGSASSSRCFTLSSSPCFPVGHFVTTAVAESVLTQILLCNTDLMLSV